MDELLDLLGWLDLELLSGRWLLRVLGVLAILGGAYLWLFTPRELLLAPAAVMAAGLALIALSSLL